MQVHFGVPPETPAKPKHHLALHVPAQMREHETSQTCLVHERKHRHVKQLAGAIKNTRVFEKALLQDLLGDQIRACMDPQMWTTDNRLVRAKPNMELDAQLGREHAVYSRTFVGGGLTIYRDDIIFAQVCGHVVVGQVRIHMLSDMGFETVLVELEKNDGDLWQPVEATRCIASSSMQCAAIWAQVVGGIRVLVPPALAYAA